MMLISHQALLSNTPAQAESLLLSLIQASRCIGILVNSDKTEFMVLIEMVPSQ